MPPTRAQLIRLTSGAGAVVWCFHSLSFSAAAVVAVGLRPTVNPSVGVVDL